jgi:hypothetical protein
MAGGLKIHVSGINRRSHQVVKNLLKLPLVYAARGKQLLFR